MACTRYSPTHVINAFKEYTSLTLNAPFKELDPEDLWERATAKRPSIIEKGDFITNALEQCKSERLITGYSKVETIEEMKHSLLSRRLICTGSNNGDWYLVATDKYYTLRKDGRTVGHAFCIV